MNLSEDRCRDLFAAARSACLGTVDAAGAPHLVPVTFAVSRVGGAGAERRDRVYFAVDGKPKRTNRLKRLENIRAHAEVCLLADLYDADWTRLWWVRADGVARILAEDPGENEDIATPIGLLAAKYPQYARQPPQGPVVDIDVTRWTGWAYGAEPVAQPRDSGKPQDSGQDSRRSR